MSQFAIFHLLFLGPERGVLDKFPWGCFWIEWQIRSDYISLGRRRWKRAILDSIRQLNEYGLFSWLLYPMEDICVPDVSGYVLRAMRQLRRVDGGLRTARKSTRRLDEGRLPVASQILPQSKRVYSRAANQFKLAQQLESCSQQPRCRPKANADQSRRARKWRIEK